MYYYNYDITELSQLNRTYYPRYLHPKYYNTETKIVNKTDLNFFAEVTLIAGNGSINTKANESKSQWVENGNRANRYYFTQAGINGDTINLKYENRNYTVLGGKGSMADIYHNRHNNYWHVDRDGSGRITKQYWGFLDPGVTYYDDYKISLEGQRKRLILFFKKDSEIIINFTSYGSEATQATRVEIRPLIIK